MVVVAASTGASPAFADDWPLYPGRKIQFSVKVDRDSKPLLSDVGVSFRITQNSIQTMAPGAADFGGDFCHGDDDEKCVFSDELFAYVQRRPSGVPNPDDHRTTLVSIQRQGGQLAIVSVNDKNDQLIDGTGHCERMPDPRGGAKTTK